MNSKMNILINEDGIPLKVVTCDGIVCQCTHKPGQCWNCCYNDRCKLSNSKFYE